MRSKLLVVAGLWASIALGQVPVFDGAVGYGRFATVASADKLGVERFTVTSLDDYDARLYVMDPFTGAYQTKPRPAVLGSLREVLSRSCDKVREIRFARGGVLYLKSDLDLPSNVRLDGWADDGQAVTLIGGEVRIRNQHDVTIRHMRLRPAFIPPHLSYSKYPLSHIRDRTWETSAPDACFQLGWVSSKHGWIQNVYLLPPRTIAEMCQSFTTVSGRRYAMFVDANTSTATARAWIKDGLKTFKYFERLPPKATSQPSLPPGSAWETLGLVYQAPAEATTATVTLQAIGMTGGRAAFDNVVMATVGPNWTIDKNWSDTYLLAKANEYGSKDGPFVIVDGRFSQQMYRESHYVQIQNSRNVLIDHCSMAWCTDEGVSIIEDSRNVTIQHCIVGPPLNWTHDLGVHSANMMGCTTGDMAPDEGITVYNNLFLFGLFRNPHIDNLGPGRCQWDIINNVFYGFDLGGNIYATGSPPQINYLSNLFFASRETRPPLYKPIGVYSPGLTGQMYLAGNFDVSGNTDKQVTMIQGLTGDQATWIRSTQYPIGYSYLVAQPLSLPDSSTFGCVPYDDDDAAYIAQMARGFTDRSGLIDGSIPWDTKKYGSVYPATKDMVTWLAHASVYELLPSNVTTIHSDSEIPPLHMLAGWNATTGRKWTIRTYDIDVPRADFRVTPPPAYVWNGSSWTAYGSFTPTDPGRIALAWDGEASNIKVTLRDR